MLLKASQNKVMKMFGRIREYLEEETNFVIVLIDEVESLTAARSGKFLSKAF